MQYRKTMWAEMFPDVYGGPFCDEHEGRWNIFADGDKDDEFTHDDLVLDPKTFPPGTKIVISVPVCPECHDTMEMHNDSICNFDWKKWTEETYG